MTSDVPDGTIRLRIDPEPSPEETAAIVAVVGALMERLTRSAPVEPPSFTPGRERWARAGRREVLRSPEGIRE